jgi:hypothetical protein
MELYRIHYFHAATQVFDLIRNFLKARGLNLAEEALRCELQAPSIAGGTLRDQPSTVQESLSPPCSG